MLFQKFNEAFWNEELGFYAYTLDGDKKAVFSIASNPGHCLWSGIVRKDRAARVVARLMQPDMWSGAPTIGYDICTTVAITSAWITMLQILTTVPTSNWRNMGSLLHLALRTARRWSSDPAA